MFIWRETAPERTMPRAGLRGSAISVAQSALQIAVEVHGASIIEEVLLWALVARGAGGAQMPTSLEVHLSPLLPPLPLPQQHMAKAYARETRAGTADTPTAPHTHGTHTAQPGAIALAGLPLSAQVCRQRPSATALVVTRTHTLHACTHITTYIRMAPT